MIGKKHIQRALLLRCCVLLLAGASAYAQGPGHPPPPPPGSHPPPPPPSGGNGNGAGGPNTAPPPMRASVTSGSGIKLGPPGRWWDDRTYIHQIGLTSGQQKKMDGIFNANKNSIIDAYKAFEKQQAALQALSRNPQADKAAMFAAIDAVSQARAALEKANTQMLLQIRDQLDTAQVEKLEKLP